MFSRNNNSHSQKREQIPHEQYNSQRKFLLPFTDRNLRTESGSAVWDHLTHQRRDILRDQVTTHWTFFGYLLNALTTFITKIGRQHEKEKYYPNHPFVNIHQVLKTDYLVLLWSSTLIVTLTHNSGHLHYFNKFRLKSSVQNIQVDASNLYTVLNTTFQGLHISCHLFKLVTWVGW